MRRSVTDLFGGSTIADDGGLVGFVAGGKVAGGVAEGTASVRLDGLQPVGERSATIRKRHDRIKALRWFILSSPQPGKGYRPS